MPYTIRQDTIQNAASARLRRLLEGYRKESEAVDNGPCHWAIFEEKVLHNSRGNLRGIIGIPTRGCSYARTKWKGCSVCGHSCSTLWNPEIEHSAIISDVFQSMQKLAKYNPPVVCLYTSGSFLDDAELPSHTRNSILSQIASFPWVRTVIIESLPRYVKEDTLKEVLSILNCHSLSIGMGLDSSNDFIRQFCLQRHMSIQQYADAVNTCLRLGVETIAYIVHQPPLLSQWEAIVDTTASIADAFRLGFNYVSVEPTALQAGTLQNLLLEYGFYKAPTLWSVVRVMQEYANNYGTSANFEKIRLGGQVFTPIPQKTLAGCHDCLSQARSQLPMILSHLFSAIPVVALHGESCGEPLRELSPETLIDPVAIIERTSQILTFIETHMNERRDRSDLCQVGRL